MAIDPYSLCPGGTGKKIKFCCSDLMGELGELIDMLDGDQHVSALRFIESLEAKGPPRACLLALKIQTHRLLNHTEETGPVVAAFLAHFPDNPIALAESAIEEALAGNTRKAVEQLQRALAARDQIEIQVYNAMGIVAQALLAGGFLSAPRALWQLQAMAQAGDDPAPARALTELGRSRHVPILLKEDPRPVECPERAAWRVRFEEAMQPIRRAQWLEGARRLEALAGDVPDAPAIWCNLALVRGWLADAAGQIEALRRFAALDVPLEDAVEAEATAILLDEEGLGDLVEAIRETVAINDADHLVAVLSTCKQAVRISVDPEQMRDDDVPPKAVFQITDRAMPESAEGLGMDDVPTGVGQFIIYGRQTDRPARLVAISIDPDGRAVLGALQRQLAGDQIAGEPEVEVLDRASGSRMMLRRVWRLPPDVTRAQIDAWAKEHLERVLLERWPTRPLGLLGGRTPADAAGDPSLRVKLLAAILVLESWTLQTDERFDFNRLRARLGLPVLAPIDPEVEAVDALPLARLGRVMADKLPDDALVGAFHRAMALGAFDAAGKLAQVLVDRPGIGALDKADGYQALAQLERDLDRVLPHIERGREATESAGESSAPWDLMELTLRTNLGQIDHVRRLVDHLQREHGNEPGVAPALMQFLLSIGAIRPDGTPAAAPPSAEAAVPPDAPASPGLWTPDGPAPKAPSSSHSKIWTPGME
ncbi:MAG: hypothetical protein JW809_13800 [Pirellulales bacterium]|nr:hypothetical protein [Pirellulales bacterium]